MVQGVVIESATNLVGRMTTLRTRKLLSAVAYLKYIWARYIEQGGTVVIRIVQSGSTAALLLKVIRRWFNGLDRMAIRETILSDTLSSHILNRLLLPL